MGRVLGGGLRTLAIWLGPLRLMAIPPSLWLGATVSTQHAYELLTGEFQCRPEKQVISWASPSVVIKRADIFFYQGHPFRVPLRQ